MDEGPVREIELSGSSLAALMQAVLERNASFRFRAAGSSMTPFIRDRDVVTVYPKAGCRIRPGDVVAAVHPQTGKLIVHRVVADKGTALVIKGDNCLVPDGRVEMKQILGVVQAVTRDGKRRWFGAGTEKRLVAWASQSGILNRLLLPGFRKIKRL